MYCPNCEFVEIEETEVGADLAEFDCVGCGFRWLSDMTIAEVEQAAVEYRSDREVWAQAEREANPMCPPEHPRTRDYACRDCVDAVILRTVPQVSS